MSTTTDDSPTRAAAAAADGTAGPSDPHMEKIGEAAATYFCSAKFSEVLGKEIDKRARADKAEKEAAANDQRAPMPMQLSTGKSAKKAVKKNDSEEKSGEGERKRAKSGGEEKKSGEKKSKSRSKSAHTSKHRSASTSSSESSSSSSEEDSSSSSSEESEEEDSPPKKSSRKSRSKKHKKRKSKPATWKKPRFMSSGDCRWKAPDNTNKRRYAALEKIGNGLHKFRKGHVDREGGASAIAAFNVVMDGVTREMNLIRIAETAEHGWLTVAELEKGPDTTDKKLLKEALKADARLKEQLGAKGRNQQPFRFGQGGSAVSKRRGNGRSYQKDQQSTTGNASSDGPRQQQGGNQQRGRGNLNCFICDQPGHFQRACPKREFK